MVSSTGNSANIPTGWTIIGLIENMSWVFFCGMVLILSCGVKATLLEDIGYDDLRNAFPAIYPKGEGVSASHVEAYSGGHYAPDQTYSAFAGKAFTLRSGDTGGASAHATSVGDLFYGNNTVAREINTIDCWNADMWLAGSFLHRYTSTEPGIERCDVQNHSWVGTGTVSWGTEISRRYDYTIQRDDYIGVAAVNNGGTSSLPAALAHSYNGIIVGRSDGEHSHGLTYFDGVGRIKPDIVAPKTSTSSATPVVSSCAGLLVGAAMADPALTNAKHSEVIKSLLFSGATKDEFADWDRTAERPLDDVFGAGEVNIYRSYMTLIAGEQDAGGTSLCDKTGWDMGMTNEQGDELFYFFEVDEIDGQGEVSIALSWNRTITNGDPDSGWSNPGSFMANMDLELWRTDGEMGLMELIDSSTSEVDNVEHIWREDMENGQYAIRLLSDIAGYDYAISWYGGEMNLPGDYNGDRFVDQGDYTVWSDSYGQTGDDLAADANGDGFVDQGDYTIWADQYGGYLIMCGVEGQAVPEPCCILLFLAGGGLVLFRQR